LPMKNGGGPTFYSSKVGGSNFKGGVMTPSHFQWWRRPWTSLLSPSPSPVAWIDFSWTCNTSTLANYYLNFIARELYAQNSPNSKNIQYWLLGSTAFLIASLVSKMEIHHLQRRSSAYTPFELI